MKINIRGGLGPVMGDKYIKSEENKKILYFDANNLSFYFMSESLLYDEIKLGKNIILEDTLDTDDDGVIGFFVEVDLKNPDNIRKNKTFSKCSWI